MSNSVNIQAVEVMYVPQRNLLYGVHISANDEDHWYVVWPTDEGLTDPAALFRRVCQISDPGIEDLLYWARNESEHGFRINGEYYPLDWRPGIGQPSLAEIYDEPPMPDTETEHDAVEG